MCPKASGLVLTRKQLQKIAGVAKSRNAPSKRRTQQRRQRLSSGGEEEATLFSKHNIVNSQTCPVASLFT